MISAAIFGWGARKRSFEVKDGMQVLCHGKLSVYPPRGSYQLVIDRLEPLGAGALQIAFEQLKAKLAAEGLFETARKRQLPLFPRKIAIITSPTGAAIRDMIQVMSRRAPQVQIRVIPALVQGDAASAQIIRGLELANRLDLGDLVVLARGGGSIEDLWSFNDENLARAIAGSRLPVISAVGHEIDFTISDFVADVRAPTPSAAAEILSHHWVECRQRVQDSRLRLRNAMTQDLLHRKRDLSHWMARLVSPKDRLRESAQKCDDLLARLDRAMKIQLQKKQSLLAHATGKLDALSPLRVLERGYSMVHEGADGEGSLLRSTAQVVPGMKMQIRFYDGKKTVQAV